MSCLFNLIYINGCLIFIVSYSFGFQNKSTCSHTFVVAERDCRKKIIFTRRMSVKNMQCWLSSHLLIYSENSGECFILNLIFLPAYLECDFRRQVNPAPDVKLRDCKVLGHSSHIVQVIPQQFHNDLKINNNPNP